MAIDLGNYDITVVGAGCMGSACARHLTRLCDQKICLIGPDEPDVPRIQSGRSVFGAHYDAGRITRILDPDIVWAKLAERSIQRYKQIEEESGIPFYTQCGFLAVGVKGGSYVRKIIDCARSLQVNMELLDQQQLKKKFPYFTFPSNCVGVYQPENAGHVNIRNKVEAEKAIAKKHGCSIIKEIVDRVCRVDNDRFKIITEAGNYLYSKKVVVATGAFTSYKNLLADSNNKLDMSTCTQTVVKFEVEDEELQQIPSMPSVVCNFSDSSHYDCYILPPIRYSDGKYYVKAGHGEKYVKPIHGHKQLIKWFCDKGSKEAVTELKEYMRQLMPDIKQNKLIEPDCCASTNTPHSHLMVGEVRQDLMILVGGNGYAAKSADEIGRVGALAVLNNQWTYDIPQDEFRICYQSHL